MSDNSNKDEIMEPPGFGPNNPEKCMEEPAHTQRNDFAPTYEQSLRIEQYIRDHGVFSLPSVDEDQSLSRF